MDILKEGLLKVEPGLLLWTIITFIILLLILWRAAWKPLVNALDLRAEKVRNDIEAAEKNRIEAERMLAQYMENLEKAKDEAARIIAEGKAEGVKIKNEVIEKAHAESKEMLERAKKEIILAKDKAIAELYREVAGIATDIASKIIVKNLKPEDQKSIIEDALSKIRTVQ